MDRAFTHAEVEAMVAETYRRAYSAAIRDVNAGIDLVPQDYRPAAAASFAVVFVSSCVEQGHGFPYVDSNVRPEYELRVNPFAQLEPPKVAAPEDGLFRDDITPQDTKS